MKRKLREIAREHVRAGRETHEFHAFKLENRSIAIPHVVVPRRIIGTSGLYPMLVTLPNKRIIVGPKVSILHETEPFSGLLSRAAEAARSFLKKVLPEKQHRYVLYISARMIKYLDARSELRQALHCLEKEADLQRKNRNDQGSTTTLIKCLLV